MRISVILPTYNERDSLPQLVAAIAALGLHGWEVVVVDDHSPDRTGDVAETLGKQYPLKVIHRPGKLGLASAVVAGLWQARGEYLVVMDSDLSHDPSIIPALVAELATGAELVVGSRFVTGGGIIGWPVWRQAMSKVATAVARMFFHIPVRDPMSGYFALTRSFFTRVAPRLNPQGYKILLEMIVRGNPQRVSEVGFSFRDRRYGKSKVTPAVIAAYLRMVWDLRRR